MGLPFVLAALPTTVLLLIGVAIGIGLAYGALALFGKRQLTAAKREAERLVGEAKNQAEVIVKEAHVDAKAQFIQRLEEFEKQSSKVRDELKEAERRLEKRADNLDKKLDTLAAKERMLEQGEQQLRARDEKLTQQEEEVRRTLEQERQQLLRITGMGVEEARSLLLSQIRSEVEHDAAEMIEKVITEAKETAHDKSRDIVVTAIQRYATEHTSASTVSTVDIPSDDMKGRVIGREGRNIRAF
jgi:ribonuclease Y